MNYEKRFKVKLTLSQLKEMESEIWRMAATAGQEELIRALELAAWPPEGPAPAISRGDLGDSAWKVVQRLIMTLKIGVNAPTLRSLREERAHEGPPGKVDV